MKTIFDKIDPKYIECATGACEHASHKINYVTWFIICVALTCILTKYYHGVNTTRSRKN